MAESRITHRQRLTELESHFAEGLQRLIAAHPTLQLNLDWQTGVALIASIQLSLRHPLNKGETSSRMRELVDLIIGRVEKTEPLLAELLRMGDDPDSDV